MTDDELRFLRIKFKHGEYDGTDIMSAWIALDELVRLREEVRRLESALADCEAGYEAKS